MTDQLQEILNGD